MKTLFNIADFGAKGDGINADTAAIQKALDACAVHGGTVVVPAGRKFLFGSVEIKSHTELHLEPGSELLGSPRIEDYTAAAFPGATEPARRGWAGIVAQDAENISITGAGTINGNGGSYAVEKSNNIYRMSPRRPFLMSLHGCRNVTIRDVTLRDSANWALHLTACEDVNIDGIRILNDLRLPNCDGIDPDHCRNVRITNCLIEAGDDCIVLKNRAEADNEGPTENVTISNCILCSTSTAIKIGTESFNDFRNIVITNCIVRSSNRGLSIQLRDHGNVENVLFSDCIVETRHFDPHWWGRAEPIYVTAVHRNQGSRLGHVRNVRFRNIVCRSESGAFIAGSEDSPIEDLLLENVGITIAHASKWPGGIQDRRPCMSPDTAFSIDPELDVGLVRHPTAGIFMEHTRAAVIRHTRVSWNGQARDHWGPAMESIDSKDTVLDNFEGVSGNPTKFPAMIRT
jgi:hypothetical protein